MERARLSLKHLILVSVVLALAEKLYRRSGCHTWLLPQAGRAVLSAPLRRALCKCSCLLLLLVVPYTTEKVSQILPLSYQHCRPPGWNKSAWFPELRWTSVMLAVGD